MLLLGLSAALPPARAQAPAGPDSHLAELRPKSLLGIWSCQGTDRTGAAFHSTLEWGFNDVGEFFFNADPRPATMVHPVSDESWLYDLDLQNNGYWRAVPDAGAQDPATWTTRGWAGSVLLWNRVAPSDAPQARIFQLTSANHLIFRQQQGAARMFGLTCVRTVINAPR